MLGSILVLVNFLLDPFASAGLLSVILVSLLTLATGGLHLDGVGDTFDGLGAGGDRDRVLSVMDDSHIESLVSSRLFWCYCLKSTPSKAWTATVGGRSWSLLFWAVGGWCYWPIAPRQPKRDWVRI